MSYDISLRDPVTGVKLEVDVPHHVRGGTYAMGGTTELWLNCTYNYAKHFYRIFEEFENPANLGADEKPRRGIRVIYGLTGAESIPILKAAIAKLGDDVHEDYWNPTEGNTKRALCGLLSFAQLRPDGVWEGD